VADVVGPLIGSFVGTLAAHLTAMWLWHRKEPDNFTPEEPHPP
jgi:hypothetical protein